MEQPTPGKKKSNNLGGLSGSPRRSLVYGRTLSHSRGEEYQKIMRHALAIYAYDGREAAVLYLSEHRSWLIDYCGSGMPLPSSGAILDSLLKDRSSRK